MIEEIHFYSSCSFYILKEGNSRKKCLNKYSDAKSYGAIACFSEVLSIASDFTKENIKFEFDKNIIKESFIEFKKCNGLSYCDLVIRIKNKKDKKSIKDIQEQFISIDNKLIKVHNFKKDNIHYIIYLKFNSELFDNIKKLIV